MTLREIESIKHRASWCNSLATAVMSGGIIVPIAAFMTGNASTGTSIGIIFIISGMSLWIGFALHETGAKFIDEIAS
jgi:hypothetical protein